MTTTTTGGTASNTVTSYYDDYTFDYGDEYMYPGYTFERPVYLYLWEILVITMFFQNLLILLVFMQRTMRSPTNIILSAMAISDSLTGLVTLPTYIMVFQRFDPIPTFEYVDHFGNQSQYISNRHNGSMSHSLYQNNSSFNHSSGNIEHTDNYFRETRSSPPQSTVNFSLIVHDNKTTASTFFFDATEPPLDGYALTKDLCRGFMISKYFLSKSFHTISIFLTLFLEIQRYVSMAYPYRYETCFNRFRIVKIYCILAFFLCPLLHVYHLLKKKAKQGICQWEMTGTGCGTDCMYLWVAFFVRHFIPCVALVIFTSLFIHELRKGERNFRRTDSDSIQYSRRVRENRRVSFIVTVIVVVRLIPEIPYSIFLLHNSIDVTVDMKYSVDLETNRIFHLCYEICLVCTYLSTFYIYLIVNKSFRRRLCQIFTGLIRRKFSDICTHYDFPSWPSTRRFTLTKTVSCKPIEDIEIKTIHLNIVHKPD